MDVKIIQESLDNLPAYAQIPIAFEVQRVLDLTVADSGLGGFVLRERKLARPFVKDYDSIGGNGPADWSKYFDIANWTLHSAWVDDQRVGGVVTAVKTEGLEMLERREDLAVIWDLRVAPSVRGRGLGSALFSAAEAGARAQGCIQLKVETQNINVTARQFYASRGCALHLRRQAHDGLPSEALAKEGRTGHGNQVVGLDLRNLTILLPDPDQQVELSEFQESKNGLDKRQPSGELTPENPDYIPVYGENAPESLSDQIMMKDVLRHFRWLDWLYELAGIFNFLR